MTKAEEAEPICEIRHMTTPITLECAEYLNCYVDIRKKIN